MTTTAAAASTCAASSIDEIPCSMPKRRRSGSCGDKLLIGAGELLRIIRMPVSANA